MTRAFDFICWLRAAAEPPRPITGEEVVEQWRGSGGPLTHSEALRLAQAMDATGFSFEPDPRYSGHILRPNDRVILFRSEWSAEPSAAYLAAAAIARLGVIVASADGAVVPEEQAILRARTTSAIDLSEAERQRLEAYVEWLLDTPIALDAIEREAAGLPEEVRLRIGTFLVAVAGADHYISTPERWILAGSFALFGLSPDQLGAAISDHATNRPVLTESAAESPSPPSPSTVGAEGGISADDIEHLARVLAVAPGPGGPDVGSARRPAPDDFIDLLLEPSKVASEISDFEREFASKWAEVDEPSRKRAGSLLSLVPSRVGWQAFIKAWRGASLGYWLNHAAEYPHAFAILFGGFAFFEYEEASFWPQFKRDLWNFTEAQTTALRTAHEKAIARLGLEMIRNQSSDRMTVGSAVRHIGVPLTVWADFLAIADYVLRQPDWQSWSSEHWRTNLTARCGPRTRLRDFLVANEATARETIDELGQIRDFANADPDSTIEDLADVANVPFLRDEYFDEVPETAEFFRPENLLSLFAGRYFLRFDDEYSRLEVHLPRVDEPDGMIWRVGKFEQSARREPAWMTVDSMGFEKWVDVHLDSRVGRRTKRIPGVGDWGLYDQRREAFLNLDLRHTTELRMGDYVLVCPRPLTHMSRTGFLGEFPENQATTLSDGTRCYVTRLSPARPDGSLEVRWATADGDLRQHTVSFRTRLSTRARTMMINGVERPMGDPSLPWYFLRPGPYPPITYRSLTTMELTKMANQGSANAYARLRRYTEEGVITARSDGAWRLDRERARIVRLDDAVEVWLLGLPTHLWALGSDTEPTAVDIVGEGGLTYLRATWPLPYEASIRAKLDRFGIPVVNA